MQYFLSPTAIRHLKEHKKWSLHKFGYEITRKYFQDIDKGMSYISHNAGSVPKRSDLTGSAELNIYPVREHYILFTTIEKVIYIVDILGQAQDIPTILKENASLFARELSQVKSQISKK